MKHHLLCLAVLIAMLAVLPLHADTPVPALDNDAPPRAEDLSTPRRTVLHFVDSARAGNYHASARALNLPPGTSANEGAELAWKLKFVLDQTLWFVMSEIPDRADGTWGDERDEPGAARRMRFKVGAVPLRETEVPITLQRINRDDEMVWLFSRDVVKSIGPLYNEYGIGVFGAYIPDSWHRIRFLEIYFWQWVGFLVVGLVSIALALILHWILLSLLTRAWPETLTSWKEKARERVAMPLGMTLGFLLFHAMVGSTLALAEPVRDRLYPILFVLIVISFTWLLIRSITVVTEALAKEYGDKLKEVDDVRSRTFETHMVVMRRIANFLLVLLAAGIALFQFDVFRTIGTSLLASAGLAGIIIGLAAQRTMGNIFAGVQLALAQPVRIGDSVVFEGEWGWIEEITYTYVVIRIWDLRRLVVPINYLLDRPIQNWTKTSSKLLGTVFIYTDYRCPIDKLRDELRRICENSPKWDGQVAGVQVTNAMQSVLEVRALCSAADAGSAWELRCHVREKLIEYLQNLDGGRYLPRTRVELYPDEGKPADPGLLPMPNP